jgi:hypothetical protein
MGADAKAVIVPRLTAREADIGYESGPMYRYRRNVLAQVPSQTTYTACRSTA